MTPATIGTATLARSVTLMTFEYYRLLHYIIIIIMNITYDYNLLILH
jgi:hypothetical protein